MDGTATATQAITGKATSPILTLLPHHYQELRASGIPDDFLTRPGAPYSEENSRTVAELLNQRPNQKRVPALVFPYLDHTGQRVFSRIKPAFPQTRNGRPQKYQQPTGVSPRVYFPFGNGVPVEGKAPVYLVEGEKKALAMLAAGFPAVGLAGVNCWCKPRTSRLLPDLERIAWNGRFVFIVFDSDRSENSQVEDAARMLAAALKVLGAIVKLVVIPPGPAGEDGKPTKQGADDFLVRYGADEFRRLVEAAEDPQPPDAGLTRPDARAADPGEEAAAMLTADTADGLSRLRFWQGQFFRWQAGAYRVVPVEDIEGRVTLTLSRRFTRVRGGAVCDTIRHLKAQAMLASSLTPPCWIGGNEPCQPGEVLACRNGLLRLAVDGNHTLMPPTPRFFTTASLGYGYRLDAPRPERWLQFLDEILPDDSVSVNLLQEFAGYLLTPDNRHGKILAICGPTRAGKGTFSEVCRHLVGRENTAAPMLHSLAGDFGKQPLLGKTLMVVSDARLSSKTDQASVLETLLRISGNDPITVHRKFLPAVDVVLPCRIIILTNEMPRLYDPNGAIAGRMLFVKLTRSFLGREDKLLKPTLETEIEGILGWAIEGWQRLQQRGYFLEPESSQEMNEEMQDLASPIGRFVREKCSLGEGLQVQRSELYEEWKTWCEEVGDKYPGDDAQFGKMLLAACPTVRTCRPREGDRRPRTYRGIDVERF